MLETLDTLKHKIHKLWKIQNSIYSYHFQRQDMPRLCTQEDISMDTILMVRCVRKGTSFKHEFGLIRYLFYRKNKYLQRLLSECLVLMPWQIHCRETNSLDKRWGKFSSLDLIMSLNIYLCSLWHYFQRYLWKVTVELFSGAVISNTYCLYKTAPATG